MNRSLKSKPINKIKKLEEEITATYYSLYLAKKKGDNAGAQRIDGIATGLSKAYLIITGKRYEQP